MSPPEILATGLGGAIGSEFNPTTNQLFFVEYDGKVSRLDLIRPAATIVSSGTTTLEGTFLFDFDTGTMGGPGGSGWDVWWRQQTSVKRRMEVRSGAGIVRLGGVGFNTVSAAALQGLSYGTAPIIGNNDASNQLTSGTVFAVRTSAGNYAKVLVIQYGYNMKIRWITYRLASAYSVLGTGYDRPEDIALSADGAHAYVTERGGKLLRVKLTNANRAAATEVAGGMTAPHQIVLDEEHGQAYLVEFAPAGRLLRVDLGSGAKTVLAAGLERAIGLLLTDDKRFAYVSQQAAGAHQISRIDLASGTRETFVTGLSNPFFMIWTDPGESGILLTERDPANRVVKVDLTRAAPQVSRIVTGLPMRPSSVALAGASRVLVCCNDVISATDLGATVFSAAGPLLMGVGHVPRDRITQSGAATVRGYADTTADPGYFFQVKDAPFGGTVSLMFNHTRAFDDGARYYRLWVDADEPRQTFHDYRWSTSTNRFELQQMSPATGGYYRVRRPGEIWYNHWLGYRLVTSGLADGLHRVRVRIYQAQSGASEIGTDSFWIRIDNRKATATIDEIIHQHHTRGSVVVGTCGIVDAPRDRFRFRVTAFDPEGHLRSWRLRALWGDNKSKAVSSRTYVPTPTKKWFGFTSSLVPSSWWSAAVPGDPTSTRCAHTFHLEVWDRVINGYNHIHRSRYHKSITIMLP